MHEDVIGVAGDASCLLCNHACVRHGSLDLSKHMQRDGLLRQHLLHYMRPLCL